MGLFDNKPLTFDEVKAVAVCECGAIYAEHSLDNMTAAEIDELHRQYHVDRPAASCGTACRFRPSRFCARTKCRRFVERMP